MNNTFTNGLTSITFPSAPTQGETTGLSKYQQNGRGSDGSFYNYTKSILTLKPFVLSFECLSLSKKDEAMAFFGAAGLKYPLTWVDHIGVSRTVKNVDAGLSWSKDSSNSFSINIQLEETI